MLLQCIPVLGRQYDEHGNLHNWWDSKTQANFMERKKCFIRQYGSIVIPNTYGTHVSHQTEAYIIRKISLFV